MEQKDIVHIVQNVIRKEWNRQALTDFNGESMQYKDLGRKIAKLHLLFEHTGIQPGDKIALCGKNSAQWAVSFFAIMTYGAVVVPLLHEFKPDNLHHLVNHSDAKLLFVDSHIYENLDPDLMPNVAGVVRIHDFSLFFSRNDKLSEARAHLNEYFGAKYPERFTPEDVNYYEVKDSNSLALINYTSGSTGFSKGVMVPHRAIWSNVEAVLRLLHNMPKAGDSMVCMLPMAHMYGLVIDLCHGICKGAHLYFLTRQPSPKVLVDAFRQAQPRLIITVPLIIEKIIKTKVFPTLDRPLNRLLLHTPYIDKKVLEKVRAALMETFGGKLEMMIVGGAALNREVEEFLHRINFPITVGYGMTECAPLIGFSFAKGVNVEQQREYIPTSCGAVVPRMQAKILSPDPEHIPGELMVKGDNVMLGYYKNDQATEAIMRPDGWMLTGDVGTIDADNNIFLRGRNKTMILGPNGQNIYPEEIEQKLNNLPYVAESLVIDAGEGRLKALIYPDLDEAQRDGLSRDQVMERINQDIQTLNPTLEAYQRIHSVKFIDEEFEKTPKKSIKRYLYTE
ncbi:MAG: AMP-binding protein [Bacteroides sp.]|nr:AMP-binding protein [Bacteroides sp.]MCM1379403.1 AMP-binding protein [Bacteroides sp.]MCM1445263.1 AMP-binding protein [Prevotella sp.]